MAIRHDDLVVAWLGYATVRLETPDDRVVYFDPGRYGVLTGEWTPIEGGDPADAAHPRATDHAPGDADLVCVTHDHHYDPDGIDRVAADDATLVVSEGVDAERISDRRDEPVTPPEDLPYRVLRIGDEDHLALDDVDADVWSVPAYNDPDGPNVRENGDPYHPPGVSVGYRLAIAGTSIFWPGDSDVLPGFEHLEVSLFLANIAGSVCMDRHDAADLAEVLDPDLVLPIHYNTLELLAADSGAFASDVARRGVPVVLDERGP